MYTIDPDARVADLVGLLYTLNHEFNNRTDLFKIEKEMEVDIDDLMPIIYAASEMGFIKTEQGDIWITEHGLNYIRSSPKIRKQILKSAIIGLEPFVSAIKLRKFDIDELMEELINNGVQKYNNPYGKHGLEITLIEWGFYSGLVVKKGEKFEVTI